MEHEFEKMLTHLELVEEALAERRDFTCDGDDECLDAYRVALAYVAKAAKAIQHCQAHERQAA